MTRSLPRTTWRDESMVAGRVYWKPSIQLSPAAPETGAGVGAPDTDGGCDYRRSAGLDMEFLGLSGDARVRPMRGGCGRRSWRADHRVQCGVVEQCPRLADSEADIEEQAFLEGLDCQPGPPRWPRFL